jgi:DNA (cytosine-5)-methyltransferase 1
MPRNGAYRGLHSNPLYEPAERPLHTVTARNTDGYLVSPYLFPFIDDYEGPAASLAEPLGTVTSRDRFALCVPALYPWGLDVRYRMLQPRELKRAQGFPDDYEIRGNKTETTKQIGNAVPVTLAQRLVESLLSNSEPALTDYIDHEPATVETGRSSVASDD